MKLHAGAFFCLLLWSGLGLAASGMDQVIVSISAIKQVKEADLKDIAEIQQYGYKAANLQLLEGLAETFNVLMKGQEKAKQLYEVMVPAFVPISSLTIQVFLRQHGVDLVALWPKVVPTKADQDMAFAQRQLPAGFVKKLEVEIVSKIRAVFENIKNDAGNVLLLPDVKAERLVQLLTQTAKDNRRLMVRSTGKEDTMELANAGGNETIANVAPEMSILLGAIAVVIGSYFSEKSLVQRLGAGDKTIFDLPMTPVLIQEMVGEAASGVSKDDGIPRCGVMFTEEPEGGLSRETNYKQTSGISVIQASYGHNEGVVNSIVAVDTYYTIPGGRWFQVVRPKPFRVRPDVKSGMLHREDNPKSLARSGALTEKEVLALSYFGTALEKFYGRPMDVEFVVDRLNKRVAIVQARPIVHPLEQAVPCYITKPEPEALRGEVIGAAGGEVRMVNKPAHCLVAKTIGEALNRYQAEGFDRTQVRCVCIGEHAPATSHEATTFRSEGKPVLFVANYQLIEALLQKSKAVLVDTQRGLLQSYSGIATSREQLLEEGVITLGWDVYPIPAMMSVLPRLKNLITQKTSSMWNVAVQQAVLLQNDAYIAKARAQILSEDKKRADRQGLLLQRLTDALRYQQVADEIVFGFSLLSLRKGQKISEKHGKDVAAGSFAEYASAYNMLAEHAVTPELGAAWKEFVANQLTNATQKDQEKFAQMIASLYRLGGLEMWFNTVFAKGHTLDQLLKGYSSQDELFLQALGKQKGLIKSTNLEGLADPKKFEKVWNNFVDNIVSYFISPSSTGFFAQFKQAGETARILALVVMRDLVDLFDDGLKIMSRSPEYQIVAQPDVSKSDTQRIVEERDKGFVFKKMLSKNLEVLQRWLELFYSIYGDDKRFDFYLLVKAEQALQDVHLDLKCVDWGKKKKDFEPGVYNVQEGVIGSQAAWARARPNSLENIFTFIHQSQLVLLAAFTHGILGDVFELLSVPSLVKKIDQVLKKLSDQNCCISLVGVLFKGKALTLSYNWPQRNHSASIEVQFASTTGEVFFTFSMFGDGGAFWKHYLSALEVSSLAKAILPYDKRLSERGFAITWKFADAEAKNLVSVAAWIKEVVDSALNIRSKKEIFNPKKVSLSTWTLYTYFQDEGDFESALKSADNEALNEFIQRLLSDPFYVKRSIESSDYNEIARLIVRALSEELTRDQTSPDTMKERLQMLRPGDALLGNYLDLYYGKFLLERGFEGQLPIDFMRHVLNLLHLDKSFAFKELLSLFGNNFALRAELIKVFLFLFGTEVNQELFLAVYPFILEEMATNKHAADLTDGLIQALNSIDVASFDTEDKQEFFKEILRGPFLRRFQDSVSQKIFDSYIFPMLEQSNGSTEKILLILGALYSDDKDTAGFSKQEKALANYTFKEWKSLFEERNEFFVMPGLGGLLQTGFISKEEVLAFFAQQIDTYFTWIKKEQQRQLASFIELLTVFLKYVLLEGNSEEAVEKALDYLKQLSSLGLSFNEATVIGALEGLWGEFPRLMRLVRRKLRKVALRFPEMFFKNYMKFLPIKNQIGLFGSRDRSFKARDLIQNISADSLRSWRETLLASGELNEANYAEGGRAFFEDFNTSLG